MFTQWFKQLHVTYIMQPLHLLNDIPNSLNRCYRFWLSNACLLFPFLPVLIGWLIHIYLIIYTLQTCFLLMHYYYLWIIMYRRAMIGLRWTALLQSLCKTSFTSSTIQMTFWQSRAKCIKEITSTNTCQYVTTIKVFYNNIQNEGHIYMYKEAGFWLG